jgi:hypothetical protein
LWAFFIAFRTWQAVQLQAKDRNSPDLRPMGENQRRNVIFR